MAVEAFHSRIGSALANRDYTELEAAWRECASVHPEDHAYLVGVTEQMLRHDKAALAGELCLALAQNLLDKGDVEAAFSVARASLRASQRTEGLRECLVAVYRAKYAASPHLDDFLKRAGLEGEGSPRQQVEALDRLLAFEEGAYVFHGGGWGYGTVVEFDAANESIVVDFLKKKGHRIGLAGAQKILQRLPAEHIGVYTTFRQEELKKIIEESPAKVFRIYLNSHGRQAPLKGIREALVPAFLSKEEWSRWWTRAKKALVADADFLVGKGSSPMIELRVHAKSVETEIAEKMRAAGDPIARCAVAREFLRTVDLTPSIAAAVAQEADTALAANPDPTAQVALHLLKAEVRTDATASADAVRKILTEAPDLVPLLLPLDPSDRKRAVLILLRGNREEASNRLTGMLGSSDVAVADLAYDCLRDTRPDLLQSFIAKILAGRKENPGLFLWFVRGFIEGKIPETLAPGETRAGAMEKLLALANDVGLTIKREASPEGKEFLRQLRNFVTARQMKLFREHVRSLSLDSARFLHARILRNRGFTDQTKQMLIDEIEGVHPQILAAATAKEEEAAAINDQVLYTTIQGYHKKEAELRHLVDVEVPANAADLGRAASFGDISENAEYSAALEKQAWLMRRIGELRQDLERARIINPQEVTADRVVLGTRVRLRNQTKGEEETFSILGPWDVDLERGVISYLSPVGRSLIGKAAGSDVEVQLPDGQVTYTILGIEPDPVFTAAPVE